MEVDTLAILFVNFIRINEAMNEKWTNNGNNVEKKRAEIWRRDPLVKNLRRDWSAKCSTLQASVHYFTTVMGTKERHIC